MDISSRRWVTVAVPPLRDAICRPAFGQPLLRAGRPGVASIRTSAGERRVSSDRLAVAHRAMPRSAQADAKCEADRQGLAGVQPGGVGVSRLPGARPSLAETGLGGARRSRGSVPTPAPPRRETIPSPRGSNVLQGLSAPARTTGESAVLCQSWLIDTVPCTRSSRLTQPYTGFTQARERLTDLHPRSTQLRA